MTFLPRCGRTWRGRSRSMLAHSHMPQKGQMSYSVGVKKCEFPLTARNFQFDPTRVETKKGQRIKFNITNQDNFAHNAVSQNGNLAYTVLPANQMTSITWNAPTRAVPTRSSALGIRECNSGSVSSKHHFQSNPIFAAAVAMNWRESPSRAVIARRRREWGARCRMPRA